MLNTLSDPYLKLAFGIGISAIGLTALLVLVIVALRLSQRASSQRENTFVTAWRPVMMEVVSAGSPTLPAALQSRDLLYFLKLWNYLQESLRGPAGDRLNALARQLHCDDSVRRLLTKGNRAERLLALLTLGHLREASAWDELAQVATGADSLASLHAARALVKIDPLRGTELLLPLILRRLDWDIAQIAGFLNEAKQAFWLHLSKNILTIDKQQWARALQLANALHLQLPLPSLQYILSQAPSVETLVAALHMASGPPLLPAARDFLHHPDWRVRVESAHFLGKYGDAEDLAPLQSMLDDSQWWVRYHVAQALADMPFFGTQKLSELCSQTTDATVRDMLAHVLAEHAAGLTP